MKAITNALACILLVAVLSFGQVAWAQGNMVHSCRVNTAPTLDGIMGAGEWASQCTYSLQLKGVDEDPETPPLPPPDKPMALFIVRDSGNLYLAFQWNHDPLGAGPNEFLLGLGFDFNANGVWEDTDHDQLGLASVHTIDDALLLVYLGISIGDPNPPQNAWIKIYLPDGLWILSWGDKDNDGQFQFDAIGGPPAEPGTIYDGVAGPVLDGAGNPVAFPFGVGSTVTGGIYTYTMEIAVPRALFHSPAGFGFLLSQKTGLEQLAWTWPTLLITGGIDLGDAESAEILGKLVGDLAGGWDKGLLDPGSDPVGGVMTSVDKVSLAMPWIAALAMLGTVVVIAASRKRRT